MANSKKIKFRLSRNQAVWDPNVQGFEGLSALTIPQRLDAEVSKETDPRLYAAVERGLQYGTLIYNDKDAQKAVADLQNSTEPLDDKIVNLDAHVQEMMSNKNQTELTSMIQNETDSNILQIMMEYELAAKNKTGNVRRTLVDQIKKRIRAIDRPVLT